MGGGSKPASAHRLGATRFALQSPGQFDMLIGEMSAPAHGPFGMFN
jgi:hypothetical protein